MYVAQAKRVLAVDGVVTAGRQSIEQGGRWAVEKVIAKRNCMRIFLAVGNSQRLRPTDSCG